MSALLPHIKALKAEAVALTNEAALATRAAQEAVGNDRLELARMESGAATVLVRIGAAKLAAAEALAAEMQGQREAFSSER